MSMHQTQRRAYGISQTWISQIQVYKILQDRDDFIWQNLFQKWVGLLSYNIYMSEPKLT